MSSSIRRGEQDQNKAWFRSQRCFAIGNEWYVATREGVNVGPFKSRKEADASINRYILDVRVHKVASGSANKVAKNGVWATNNYI